MLIEIVVYLLPKRVHDELNTLSTRYLGRRHKIAVSCNQDNCVDLLFWGHRGDIDTNAHVYALLLQAKSYVTFLKALPKVYNGRQLLVLCGSQLNATGLGECFFQYPNMISGP